MRGQRVAESTDVVVCCPTVGSVGWVQHGVALWNLHVILIKYVVVERQGRPTTTTPRAGVVVAVATKKKEIVRVCVVACVRVCVDA